VNAILGAIPDLDRKNLAALEWSINEITDNVLNHSRSTIGGLVQVSTFQGATQRVEYIVADAGVGIPATRSSPS
jgi:anti-sigma regulatory factor (Ser/Thr protein kinase)